MSAIMPIKTRHEFGVDGREKTALQRILQGLSETYDAKPPFKLGADSLTIDFESVAFIPIWLGALADLVVDLRCAGYPKLADKVFDRVLMPIVPYIRKIMPE